MTESARIRPRDVRAHFRIQVSTEPCVVCLEAGTAATPSSFDGVFCVNGPNLARWR